MEKPHTERRAILALGILLTCCACASASDPPLDIGQNASRPVLLPVVDGNDIRFTQLRSEQRRLEGEVNHILQDDQGFMWFGTSDGLRRYDGYGLREYRHDPKDPNSLSGATIYSLFKDRSGKLWVGSDAFLDMFDPATDKFTHFSGPGTAGIEGTVLDIREDDAGTLWLASQKGLYRLDPANRQTVHYEHKPEDPSTLSSNSLKSTFKEKDGTFWIATENGLDVFDANTGKVTRHISVMNGTEPLRMSLFQDHAGVLWVAFSSKNGLAEVDRAANSVTQYSFSNDSGANTGVDAIYEDADGTLWLGTGSRGLLKLDRDRRRFVRYRSNPHDPESFGAGMVLALCEDQEGNMWAGTREGGVSRFDRRPSPFQTYQSQIGSSDSPDAELSPSVFEDSRGTLWIGSQAVRTRIEGEAERFSSYRNSGKAATPFKSAVRSMAEDHSGSLWFGTFAGLNRVDARTRQLRTYRHHPDDPQSLSDNDVPSLLVDHSGVLWVGTMDGLDAFDPGTERFRVYRASGAGLNQYMVITEDAHGSLWLGTHSAGLQRFDPATGLFSSYQNRPGTGSLSNDQVNAICIDRSGIIWIGTQSGLNRFDPVAQTFTVYYERDGLPSNRVTGILEDDRGNLWLSTGTGLSRFDPRAKTFVNYSASDGIVRGNIYGPHAGWKDARGEMFFASSAGVIAFFPDKVVGNSYIPPVVLTDFQLFGKPAALGGNSPLNRSITVTKSLTLAATQNILSLEFSALSYVDPERNRYRYRLEPLEKEWNETSSTHRRVTYTTLPPGDYVFHVQGSNNRGLWNGNGVVLQLRILPPWWRTWWFTSIAAMSLLFSLWCVYDLRVRALERRQAEIRALNEQMIKAQEAERMRISGELHDGVLQQITSLSLRLGVVRSQVPPDSQAKATVSGLQQQLIQIGTDIRHISHELHPALLQESGLPAALTAYCEEFTTVRGIPVSCEMDESVKELSPGAALCIYRIAQEALGNAAKYSEAKKIDVRLTRSNGSVCLSVSDDGVGCAPDLLARSGGLGVISMRERVLQLNGKFEFDSGPGRGTTVKAEVPFRPAS